ncbi:MAG: CotS family spore coat protein [Eubacterium sp.]
MEDKVEKGLANYNLTVKRRYRHRGGWLLETTQGPKLLREYEQIRSHFSFENKIKEILVLQGFRHVDEVMKNIEDSYVTELESGEKYVVYHWFSGQECDLRMLSDLALAGENLARLHHALDGVCVLGEEPIPIETPLLEKLQKHTRELKRIYTYMKKKKQRSEFEIQAIVCFERFYEKAVEATERLEKCKYYNKILENGGHYCHGDYNYHNLIHESGKLATVGFEKAGKGIPLLDLTYLMRKSLEKNGWDRKKGITLLENYEKIMPLTGEEEEFIYIMLLFPEKYWKLMNGYFNHKKSWFSEQSLHKLCSLGEMEQCREQFLKNYENGGSFL